MDRFLFALTSGELRLRHPQLETWADFEWWLAELVRLWPGSLLCVGSALSSELLTRCAPGDGSLVGIAPLVQLAWGRNPEAEAPLLEHLEFVEQARELDFGSTRPPEHDAAKGLAMLGIALADTDRATCVNLIANAIESLAVSDGRLDRYDIERVLIQRMVTLVRQRAK